MGLFGNPLGYAGYPPGATGTPETQNSTVRAATPGEIQEAALDNVYISPKNFSSADWTFDDVTVNGSLVVKGSSTLGLPGQGTTALAGRYIDIGLDNITDIKIGYFQSKIGFLGATPVVPTDLNLPGPSTTRSLYKTLVLYGLWPNGADFFDLTWNTDNTTTVRCSSLVVTSASSVPGASPVTNDDRVGQVAFTDNVTNGAYATLVLNCDKVTTDSIVIASASSTTANSAVSVVEITPSLGSISFRVYNAGSASTATGVKINYVITNT